jgi:hypothetical protein
MNSKNIGLFLISVAVGIIIFFALTGCASPPERKNYDYEICFRADYCGWLKSKKEKSSLNCGDIDKECRSLERFKNCKKDSFRWPDQKPQECWDKLNGK